MSISNLIKLAGVITAVNPWCAKLDIASQLETFRGVVIDSNDSIFAVGYNITALKYFLVKYSAGGQLTWQRFLDTAGDDIAIDSANNIYIAGKDSIAKYDNNGSFQWARKGTCIPSSATLTLTAIKVNSAGEIIVAGYANQLAVICKYTAAGALVWAKSLSHLTLTTNVATPISIWLDSSNNITIIGTYDDANVRTFVARLNGAGDYLLDFTTSGARTYGGVSDSNGDIYLYIADTQQSYFMVKYTTTGGIYWQKNVVGSQGSNQDYSRFAVDATNNIYMTGTQTYDQVITKMDSNGVSAWSRRIGVGSSISTYTRGLALSTKNVCLVGANGDTAANASNFICNGPITGIAAQSKTTPFIANVSIAGGGLGTNTTSGTRTLTQFKAGALESKSYGGTRITSASSFIKYVATDSTDTLYVCGTNFVMKVSRVGTVIWKAGVTGTGTCVKVDSSGNVYVLSANGTTAYLYKFSSAGAGLWSVNLSGFTPVADFGLDETNSITIAGQITTTSSSVFDPIIVARYDSAGTLLFQKRFTGVNNILPDGASYLGYTKRVYVTGVASSDFRILVTFSVNKTANLLVIDRSGNLQGVYRFHNGNDNFNYGHSAGNIVAIGSDVFAWVTLNNGSNANTPVLIKLNNTGSSILAASAIAYQSASSPAKLVANQGILGMSHLESASINTEIVTLINKSTLAYTWRYRNPGNQSSYPMCIDTLGNLYMSISTSLTKLEPADVLLKTAHVGNSGGSVPTQVQYGTTPFAEAAGGLSNTYSGAFTPSTSYPTIAAEGVPLYGVILAVNSGTITETTSTMVNSVVNFI